MTDLIAINPTAGPEADEEERFDFASPEDILFELVDNYDVPEDFEGGEFEGHQIPMKSDWKRWSIESATVINAKNPNVCGAASYVNYCGCGFDYLIESMGGCPGRAGWFVMPEVTAVYFRGDGWTTDDDMDFYCGDIRPATEAEIAKA